MRSGTIQSLIGCYCFVKIVEEQSVCSAGEGEEEGIPQRVGGEGEGLGNQELGVGREALHPAKREPFASTYKLDATFFLY